MTSFRSKSIPAGFRRHFVGKTLRNVSYKCRSVNDPREIVLDQLIQYYLNDRKNLRHSTPHTTSCYAHKMAIVL